MTPGQKKALDWWAREFGYNDYDTYLASGGSIDEAARNMRQRINTLLECLHAITGKHEAEADTPPPKPEPIEPGHVDEPADPANAQIQGAEFGEP